MIDKYIVIELQTYADGTVGNIVTAHDTRDDAESKFHTVLAAAAISQLPCHAAICVANDGFLIGNQCYRHEVAAPEPEPAPEE